ncbi:hypothetical protein GCM10022198_07800 [Klugiella xanthotipulae]|uniref:Thiaminase /4-amino-5-aminomethyl-2-methylpyrimidine deaminase n=1 Tax=Klugiella xanthotipulae TaxID=244735 RepID=A0A543HT47_9MICO|nr:TenA family protein [Klugiella xanthotipulae]TQM61460.1 thiaminase /4-amino-5-aminomethyl-2-methylpyrimidine deaminase [Klugiella xanthotipulae]
MSERFTDRLWENSRDIRDTITGLEFLTRLGDGTLDRADFSFYLEQDSLYLTGYAQALAILASRAPTPDAAAFWAGSSRTAVVVESELHGELLSGESDRGDRQPSHSPTCLGYVSYLIATAATAPYPVATAAVLPCFWLYADVSSRLARDATDVLARDPEHPFARWVASYNDDEFQSSVRTACTVVDAAHGGSTPHHDDAMILAFRTACTYELLFWDSALNRVPWPATAVPSH